MSHKSKGTILCFGDSNTWGYEPLTQGRYGPKYRWVDILGRESGWTAVNIGMNGRQIPHTSWEIAEIRRILDAIADPDPEALFRLCLKADYPIVFAPDGQENVFDKGPAGSLPEPGAAQHLQGPYLFWILLGTNDIQMNYGFTAEKAVERMQNLLIEMLWHEAVESGKAELRVLGPARAEVGPWSDERQQRELLRMGPLEGQMCRSLGVSFTDLAGIDIDLAADGDHFSKAGHRAVADFLMEQLQPFS